MSKMPIRVAAPLAAVLGLAAFAGPALTADDAGSAAPTVRSAAASGPVVVGRVGDAALEARQARLAAEAAQAKAAEEARFIEALAAAENAAKLEALAAAIEAEEASRAEEARQAEAAAAAAPASAGSLDAIIQRHFGDAWTTARRIAECESGMNPNAVSSTNDHGLFQINAVHAGDFQAVTGVSFSSGVYDPELNTIYARHLHAQQGWGPWTCA